MTSPSDFLHYYRARVVEVIGGDSLALDLDLGLGHWALAARVPGGQKRSRYPMGVYQVYGADCADKNRDYAKWASGRARVLELLSLSLHGDTVISRTHKGAADSSWSAEVWIEGPKEGQWTELGAQLVREGLALPGKKG